MTSSSKSPLERLGAKGGREFLNLLGARKRTALELDALRVSLNSLNHDSDTSVVLMGSWGRAEVTTGSDYDFMVLLDGQERDQIIPSIDEVGAILDETPGEQEIFGKPVSNEKLVNDIGLDRDDNRNLTRRMLFLLESIPVTNEDVYSSARDRILNRYLDKSIKDFRPPRFLLNDTVRYWRTICVDFAGKEHIGPEKWGLRNAKLRTSRKILFAGGLLPIFACARLDCSAMPEFLKLQLDMPPTDRIAQAFLEHDAVDAGTRTLGAYDLFLGLLDDESFRQELRDVTRSTADESTAFAEVRRLSSDLEAGLLALLFETDSLPKLVRDYAIF